MISLRAPSDAELAEFLVEHEGEPFSYPEVGATRGELPAGYRIDRRKEVIGRGDEAFERGRLALDRWQAHVGAGVRVTPVEPPRPDLTVALVVRAAGLYTTSGCRVAYCIREPDRVGFAYGTLRDHPVSGEERFLIERASNGEVTFELLAFSRPVAMLFKIASPFTRRTQRALGVAYIEALRTAIAR